MKHLVLFDIDYTLLISFEAHKEAFIQGLKRVHDIDIAEDGVFKYHGWTDQMIIKDLAEKHGVENPDVKATMKAMCDVFPSLVDCKPLKVLPGVPELLKALDERGVIIGLVTGNLECIARSKMKKLGFNEYFTVGGFGSDHTERGELAKIAIKRAEELGFNGKATHVGDTPADVAAGKYAGIRTLGVATGDSSMKELLACGADTVVRDLSETDVIMKILLGDNA